MFSPTSGMITNQRKMKQERSPKEFGIILEFGFPREEMWMSTKVDIAFVDADRHDI